MARRARLRCLSVLIPQKRDGFIFPFADGTEKLSGTHSKSGTDREELTPTSVENFCDGEVIVQGDEGPFRGVAQVVDCHGVTVSHQEKRRKKK